MIIKELRDALDNAIFDKETIAALQCSLREYSQLLRCAIGENGFAIPNEVWDAIDWDRFAPYKKSAGMQSVLIVPVKE